MSVLVVGVFCLFCSFNYCVWVIGLLVLNIGMWI